MKTLTVFALVCAMAALTGAAAVPEEKADEDQTADINLAKRTFCSTRRCSRGWTRYNGRCFRFVPRPMTWAAAEKNCMFMGGHLASIHNILEYLRLLSLMSSSRVYKKTWIGGTDAQEEKQWFWSDGTPFNYVKWCRGEPNNSFGKQHCLDMNHEGYKCWDDLQCNRRSPSICAKNI
ncbi:galactose-specific lectin nattectin-like [Sander lucioperca]|uniref:Ladderlectin-like n=1 Tax=Sander lucioperca TaxID=283035 RepID=A0A8C9ZEA9_SANLU|nr:galactose-specific lectin nattectin-like [Sander lucioperca]